MKTKIQSVKVVACTHNGKLNGHIVPRHLKNKGSADDMWDVEARIIRESDFRAMQRIVRNAADPNFGIAAWKSKQPPSTNDVPAKTKLVVTPELLQEISEWFDSPVQCEKAIKITISNSVCTAGYLLRRIKEAVEGGRG